MKTKKDPGEIQGLFCYKVKVTVANKANASQSFLY